MAMTLNIDRAGFKELLSLPGVGKIVAQQIIDRRKDTRESGISVNEFRISEFQLIFPYS